MALITPKNGDLTAGVAGQSSDVLGASPDPFLTGDFPAISSDIYPVAAATNLPPNTVVGFSGGYLTPAVYEGPIGDAATGAITFTGVNVDTKTVTIGATVYTSATVADDPHELPIATTADEAAANLAEAINGDRLGTPAHPDVTATASGGVVTVTAKVGGTAGNSIDTTTTEDNATWGGATLSGGAAATGGVDPIGITKYGKDNTDGGAGDANAEVYRSGVFNPDLLVWDSSFTDDELKRRAFEGAPTPTFILIRKPTTMTVA